MAGGGGGDDAGPMGAADLQRHAAMQAAKRQKERKELEAMSSSSEDPDEGDLTDDEEHGADMRSDQRPGETMVAARKRRKRQRDRKRRRLTMAEEMVEHRPMKKNHINALEEHFELDSD